MSAEILRRRGSRLWKQRAKEEKEERDRKSRFFPHVDEADDDSPEPENSVGYTLMKKPSWLDADGAVLWDRIAPGLLKDNYILEEEDAILLAMACRAYADYVRALAVIDREGCIATYDSGNAVQHPAVGVANTSRAAFVKLMRELRDTPASRREPTEQ